jgi:hypothetical protein
MVYMCGHVAPMPSDSHLRVHYAACQCLYVLLPMALLAFINRSILQWSAMYGLGGNTTRVSRADENLTNLFCVQEIIQEKYGGQLFAVSSRHEKHPNLDPPLILTYQHLVQMFSL